VHVFGVPSEVDPVNVVVDFGRDFVKLPRSVIAMLARYPLALTVYLVLLGRARYAPGAAPLGPRLVDLEIGEAVAGRADLAAVCSTSENTIRTALDHLQRLRLITIKTTNRGSKVTICGYAETSMLAAGEPPTRAPAESPATAPANHQQNASQITTNKILRSKIQDGDLGEARKRARPRASRRVPSEWQPRPGDALLRSPQLESELATFRDHEFPSAKSDWDATWRNWQRKAERFAPSKRNNPTETALEGLRDAEERERRGEGPTATVLRLLRDSEQDEQHDARAVDLFDDDVPHAAEVAS
jgi:hypothetical protein